MSYQAYASTLARANRMEERKRPGQKFCDSVGWQLLDKYKILQRPDKVTMVGGTIYRTITPTTHIWYQKIDDPHYHVWVEFGGENSVVVKNRIAVRREENPWGGMHLYPNPNNYESLRLFGNNTSARDYILSL